MADPPQPPETKIDREGDSPGDGGVGSSRSGEPNRSGEPQSAEELASWHRLAGVGIEFIAAFGLCAAVGWWLDKTFATAPWLLIAGCALGFTVGLWSLVKAARKMM